MPSIVKYDANQPPLATMWNPIPPTCFTQLATNLNSLMIDCNGNIRTCQTAPAVHYRNGVYQKSGFVTNNVATVYLAVSFLFVPKINDFFLSFHFWIRRIVKCHKMTGFT